MQINLIQHDANFNFVQSIDMYRKVAGGHANLETVEDVRGGYKGGSFELSASSRSRALRINEGHCFSAWQDGWPVYAGRVMSVDNTGDGWRIEMMGLIQLFGQSVADITFTDFGATQAFQYLIHWIGFGPQLSDYVGYMPSLTNNYNLGTVKFSKTTIQSIWDTYNASVGCEYGSILYDDLNLGNAKTIMYLRNVNTTLLRMTIDAASLKTCPVLKPDFRTFGTWTRVYYGQAGRYEDVHGKVITGIDLSLDKVYIADHDFITGEAINVWNYDGTRLPAPLATGTVYYAIYYDVDNIKFATSLANANAGTAIDLTTYGTGVQSVSHYPNSSEDYYGEMIYPLDISSETSTPADAGRVGQIFLDGLMQDGMYRPPLTVDITLDADTRIDNPGGSMQRNIWRMHPGDNVMLMNLKDVIVRDLRNLAQPAFVHVLEMQRDYGKGQVRLRCRRGFDPAVILARAKGS